MKQSFTPSRICPDGGQVKDVYMNVAHMKNSPSLMENARRQYDKKRDIIWEHKLIFVTLY